MNCFARIAVIVPLLFISPVNSGAQDLSDMFGTWEVSAVGFADDPTCGQERQDGVLQVLQRTTMENYEIYSGIVSANSTFDRCDKILKSPVKASLIVDGDTVTITYGGFENWSPDLLKRNGDVMEGQDGKGITSRWVKTSGPSDSDRAAVAKENLAQVSYEQGSEIVRSVLMSQGYDESEAESRLWQFFEDAAACEVDALMISAAEQSLSFYELVNLIDPGSPGLTNTDLMGAFDSKLYMARSRQCQKDLDIKYGF